MLPRLLVVIAFAAAPTSAEIAGGIAERVGALRGDILVLNFWATWCVPCREEMPMLEQTHVRYAARGVSVIGASTDDATTRARVAEFVRKHRITFPIWEGATTDDMQRLQLGTALPATAIFDRDGTIAFRLIGPLKRGELHARIDYLLGNRTGMPPSESITHLPDPHEHEEGEAHAHGGVGMEGASTVPS